MTTARSQVARLMALAPYLRARPEGIALSALAAEFEVSAATMRKDLQTLVMCGLPDLLPDDLVDIDLEAFEDDAEGIVRIHNADFMPRPTRLSSGEAASLLVALDSIRPDSDPETQQSIDQVRAKIEAAATVGAAGRATVVPSRRAGDTTGIKATIEAAISDDQQVLLCHLNATRDEVTDRAVDPLGTLTVGGRDYLDAWCHRSGARRLFRFDRIESVSALQAEREHPDQEPRSAHDQIFQVGDEVPTARLLLRPPARWMTEYYPILSRTEIGDGSLEVELGVSDPRWLASTVLSAAPHVEVLGPDEYAEHIAHVARATLAAYDELSHSS